MVFLTIVSSTVTANDQIPEIGQADAPSDSDFMILQTNLHPPYQELENGMLVGYSVSVLDCVFNRIGIGYGLAVAPRQRNREMVRQGRADGFFLARVSDTMEEYASASYPLALEKWVWVSAFRGNEDSKKRQMTRPELSSTVGAILGSNEAEWLAEQGYSDIARVPSVSSLISQVVAGRVQYALLDKHSFEIAREQQRLRGDQFVLRFERYAPLVVYFAKAYLEKKPDLLDQVNGALEYCDTQPMHMEPWERGLIERQQLPMITTFAQSERLIDLLRKNTPDQAMNDTARVSIDQTWQESGRRGEVSRQAYEIIENDLSEYLRDFQARNSIKIAEVFVFGQEGYVLGMSRLISDFDQSDEDKYRMTYFINRDHTMISDIRFDASTHTFLSQITVPILDPDTEMTLGAMTVGLDVSAALRLAD
ncbi:transporter substrate-binding domain-containing protein [Thalassospira sp. MA62]|nr:transporter substrate-binding domain-containing protein [Thalassospira sp. MA62]